MATGGSKEVPESLMGAVVVLLQLLVLLLLRLLLRAVVAVIVVVVSRSSRCPKAALKEGCIMKVRVVRDRPSRRGVLAARS